MKRALVIILVSTCFSKTGWSQLLPGQVDRTSVPSPVWHYQEEYNFDTVVNAPAWNTLKKGLHVAFGSTDQLYFRREAPQISEENTSWSAVGWKGERLNAQILIWSADSVEQIRLNISDLKNSAGGIISQKNVQVNKVGYVISNYPYAAKDATCGESSYKDIYLMPDRFELFERFDLPEKTVRPVWLSIDVPQTAVPGVYNGTINVGSTAGQQTLQLQITVQNQVLPKPSEWKHRLDLWQNPWVVAWKNNVEPWSNDHKVLLKNHLKQYADAG